MTRRQTIYVGLALALAVVFIATQFRVRPDQRPLGTSEDLLNLASRDDLNVIFILVDTLRADRLGIHGYERATSPAIDRLAQTGIRFERHHSQSSWTKTSMASLWTSMYPHRNGILRYDHALPEAALLPAEIFKEEGFITAGIWRNGWVAPTFGFHQGFETYHRPAPGAPIYFNRRTSTNPNAKISGSDMEATDGAIEFLRANGQDQFFLYIHYMDAHQYLSDEESALFGTSYSDLYDNSIHWTDRHIAALMQALEKTGVRDRTVVVLTSDHGEAFQEHGSEGHAKDLFREVVHVPWIISLPFSLESEIVIPTISEAVDVWPTLFDLLGFPGREEVDGRSRLPEIMLAAGLPPERAPDVTPLFAQLDRSWGRAEAEANSLVALTTPNSRFMMALDREDSRLFFQTDSDPLEKENLLTSGGHESASSVEAELNSYLERPAPAWADEVGRVELDDLQKGQLRAIGYAIE